MIFIEKQIIMSNKKIKLLINEFEFLNKQENEVKDLFDESQREFIKDINKFLMDNGLEKKKIKEEKKEVIEKTIEEKEKKSEEKNTTEEIKKNNAPKRYKKMFSQIVSLTHPDKLKNDISEEDKQNLVKIYENTVENYNEGNYTPLILNAKNLGIEITDDFFDDLETIKNSIKEKNENIDNIQRTFAWIYYNELKEEEKEDYLKNYYDKYKDNI